MNRARPAAAVRPTHRWQVFRPREAVREPDDDRDHRAHPPEGKGPRRTLTIVFRAR